MSPASKSSIVSFFSSRKWIIVSVCIVTAAGFSFKTYSGPAHGWFNNYGAGMLYEVFWCLAVFFFIPVRKRTTAIALSVFVITCALEILQLFHPPILQQVRSTFPGRVLLGTTFVWWDFAHYALGCLLGWLLLRGLSRTLNQS